jgi:hypothetical protein
MTFVNPAFPDGGAGAARRSGRQRSLSVTANVESLVSSMSDTILCSFCYHSILLPHIHCCLLIEQFLW